MEIENTLESAVRIVRGIGEFTQESTTIFETLRNTKEYFQEVLRYNLEDRLIQNLCYSVLCGGFILIKCCYANLKKTIQEMEKEELPERLKPKVREIRSYCTSLEKKLQEIEATVTDINTTVSSEGIWCNCLINNSIIIIILLHEKFLQFDWLRAVVFQLNLTYPHVKITNLLRVVV